MVDSTLTADTPSTNGAPEPPARPPRQLPAMVHLPQASGRQLTSPGTMRTLKAQTGRSWDEMATDAADRVQTMIWSHLRKTIPDLRWDECADIEVQLDEDVAADPTQLVASATSLASADSGD